MTKGLVKKVGKGRHISAMKRERQSEKRRDRNRGTKATMKTAIKRAKSEKSAEELKKTASIVDKTASKSVIPKRRASRIISRLTKMVNATA
jgi:small subunit ribosomal protein S20